MGDERRFGRYEVRDTIGKGAMGVVYLAEDPIIGRKVAIKVVEAHQGLEKEELTQLQARFEREFQSAGRLSHPNIVGVHDVGQQEGHAFIAMEYVPGESLASILAENRVFSFKEVADLAAQLASGLDYAHEFGIVHRDIKPANILITRGGRPKITDFGVAKVATTTLTRTGTVVGTPAYMSPEQVTGHPVTGAADQFSLAVMLYQMVTGERPFTGENPTTIMYKIVHEKPVPPSVLNAMVPGPVDRALMRALSKNPLDRYPSCSEMAEALRGALGAAPTDATIVMDTGHDDRTVVDASLRRPAPHGARPAAGERQGMRIIGLAAVGAVVVALAIGLWAYGKGAFDNRGDAADPVTTAATSEPITHALSIPVGAGWQVWVDGRNTGLVTPDSVSLEGEPGRQVRVELRYGALPPIATTFTMGQGLPASWSPAEAAADAATLAAASETDAEATREGDGAAQPEPEPPVTFTVISNPAGATVTLDGEAVEQPTPAEISLDTAASHRITVKLEGYEAQGVELTPDNIGSYMESRELRFGLVPSIPPGFVTLENGAYPVAVTVTPADGGRASRQAAATSHNIRLLPGRYTVELSAPEVFYRETREVTLESEQTLSLAPLPRLASVQVSATPGNCVVYIDDVEIGPPPFNREIVVGEHKFTFDWSVIGRGRRELTERVTASNQPIIGTPAGQ